MEKKEEILFQKLVQSVENQIEENRPPFVKDTYDILLEWGYSGRYAKERIAEVLLTEVYRMETEKEEFREESYRRTLEEMIEGKREYDEAPMWKGMGVWINRGYEVAEDGNPAQAVCNWERAWTYIRKNVTDAEAKPCIMEIDEETDFEYMLHEWLPDMALMYRKAGFPEKSIAFCEKIIELFSWEDGSPNEFKKCIGEALKEAGKTDESDRWFESWLSEEPDNYECVEACIFHWMGRGENQKIRQLLERYLPEDTKCNYENQMLFMRAAVFYEMVGEKESAEQYRRESTEFTKQFLGEDIIF